MKTAEEIILMYANDDLHVDTLIKMLNEFANQDRWISVEESLPNANDPVLICFPDETTRVKRIEIGAMYNDKSWYTSVAYEDEDIYVTHWQPLPKI